ncbi:glycoside hydrolase family 2 TIM barrel-domain containing protein [Microlunatus sp. GCM10028923]|uniref:glycoside hydrolase family 2 TIM barrel-domain containing protein n=1 Tax=Microlunatus sp. GCM10028923 TaxID=3273400 RepID=UPI00361BBCA2
MRSTVIEAWSFLPADDPAAWKRNADETAFRPVTVPHDWAVEHPFDESCSSGTGYLPGGVGWYRTRCSIGALGLDQAAAVRLVFHGVYKNAQVWVNGYHVGGRPSGWSEFSFDLTELVGYAPDDDLVISVRVDHRDLADSRWYNGSGLTRRVELQAHDAVSVAHHGTMITTRTASADLAEVKVVQRLENHTDQDRRVIVDHRLEPQPRPEPVEGPSQIRPGPSTSSGHEVTVPAHGTVEVSTHLQVADPLLWSDDHPHLYRLVTMIDNESRHELVTGLRTFAFDADTGFMINGERRILRGVCLHEDAGPLGVAVPPEVWLRRLLLLKEGGCNAVRMAHNPHAPELYELCDLLGLYVIDEAFDEWENPKNKWWQGHNVYPPKHEGYAHDFPEWHVRDLEAMVDAHRHHPSVIAWSIGNEVDYPNDPYASPKFLEMTGNNDADKPAAERAYDPNRPDIRRLTTIANDLIAVVKARDASRPVTYAAAFPELSSTTGLFERLDLIGYNYKEHLYADDHRRFPDQPFVGSETSHTYAAWRHAADQDFVAGQFLWTGIDYLGETPGWPSHGSAAGLLTTAGFPKERWHLRRSWWSEVPMVRLAVRPAGSTDDRSLTRRWTTDGELEVACFTNADKASVTCGADPVELVFDADLGYWRGTVTPGGDPLIAEATVGDTTVRDELTLGSAPAALTAEVWAAPEAWRAGLVRIAGGRADVHQVECRVLDRDGRVAGEDVLVTAEVDGGELLGLDNGDLSDTTPYRSDRRSTLDGMLIAYVRGAGATVTLRAEGLPDLVVRVPKDLEAGPD